MSYTLESLEEGRVLLITEHADFDLAAQAPAMVRDALEWVTAAPDNVVIIADTRAHSVKTVNEVLAVGSTARSEAAQKLVHHPKLLKSLVVTNNAVARMTMKGINTATFGHVETFLYDSLEEALAEARTLINAGEKVH